MIYKVILLFWWHCFEILISLKIEFVLFILSWQK